MGDCVGEAEDRSGAENLVLHPRVALRLVGLQLGECAAPISCSWRSRM
jgi:hypothetical protein